MEFVAESKDVRISARKIRLAADAVRKLSLDKALVSLSLMSQRGAIAIRKTMESAVANALNNAKIHRENLLIKRIEVYEGPFLKRFRPSTRGRTHPYKKRSCHIRIVLEAKQ